MIILIEYIPWVDFLSDICKNRDEKESNRELFITLQQRRW